MIGRIHIQNYKSIEDLTLDLGRVTVLIGANGSGKSNILEAIALCSAAAANKLDNEFLFSRGIRVADDPRHMKSAFTNNKPLEEILITVHRNLSSGYEHSVILASSINNDSSDGNVLKNVVVEDVASSLDTYNASYKDDSSLVGYLISILTKHASDHPDFQLLTDERVLKDTIDVAGHNGVNVRDLMRKITVDEVGKVFVDRLSSSNDEGLLRFLVYMPENSALRRFEEEGQIQPLGIRGEGLFKLLTMLARDENRDRLNEIQERLQLLDWFGDFQIGGNVALGERTLRIRDQYLDEGLAYITQRSANEGFLFLLFYFTLFVAKETPRFFAVDNIDASLNPKLCAELLRQLTELAAKYDKQVILTTHNPAVLDGLNLRDDDQRLYVVERDLDGRTQARRVPPPRPLEEYQETVPLSEAFLRGYIGGLPKNF